MTRMLHVVCQVNRNTGRETIERERENTKAEKREQIEQRKLRAERAKRAEREREYRA